MGWFFEYETTAAASVNHAKSLRALSLYFWIPTVFISFYANFGFPEYRFFGLLIIAFFTIIALCMSKKRSEMPYNSWYHEIVLCGVDKLSMSITSLTYTDHRRSFWMLPFETYLGICIKFINPACLMFIFFNNLQEDLTSPYNNQNYRMYLFSTVSVVICAFVIVIPIFTCSYPEVFEHNVNLEFLADNLYEIKLRMTKFIRDQM